VVYSFFRKPDGGAAIAPDWFFGRSAAAAKGGTMEKNWLQRLSKSKDDRWIGGVCGGLGMHTELPSWVWRVLFCLLFFCFGTGLLIYILLWIFMPNEQL